MKRVFWLVLVCVLTAVLVSSSCSQNAPGTPPAPAAEQASPSPVVTESPPTPALIPPGPPRQPPPPPRPSLSLSPTPTPTQTKPLPPLDAFMKGFNFGDWNPFDEPQYGLYRPPGTDQSLKNLANTGTNWISLLVRPGQETYSSTVISNALPITATDAELLRIINLAHSLGMRVMLFPNLSLSNDSNHWWGQIGTAFSSEDQWQDWFASYRESINHYATFSQETGVDMLCIGRELGGTTHRESDWRRVIQEVRERFKGSITYSALSTQPSGFPHGEENRITWWDAVDYIGVSTYYKLTNKNDPTVEELKAAWTDKGHVALLQNLSNRFNKPIIFTEIGYPSADGANKLSGVMLKEAPVDLQEQADCYQAALEVFWAKPWMKGILWWQWLAETRTGGPNDNGGTPYGKPAEEVLKKFYLSK